MDETFSEKSGARNFAPLKIGEFARVARVSIATLHHYEKLDLFKPIMLDRETGYRYYTLDQLPRLNRILALKDLGFPLEQIARILETELSSELLRGMLLLKQAQTQRMIDAEQARLTRIEVRLRQIEQEGTMPAYEVLLKQVEAVLVASVRAIVPLADGLDQTYKKIAAYVEQQGRQPESPAVFLLHSRSEQREDGLYIDVETALPLSAPLPGNAQIAIRTLPGGLMACTVHTGYDLALGQAYASLYHWIHANGYQVTGPARQLRLRYGEHMQPAHYVTEVQFPIVKQDVEGI